ncbi:MAG: nitroreductase family protein [Cellvibrionaceae bacterium]
MDATFALENRVSCGKLKAPAPTADQRQRLYKAALRAADHGSLRPWRFLEIEGEGLDELGQVFERAALSDDADLGKSQRDKYRRMPTRAPLILAAIAECVEHPKVPAWEQVVTTGAAVQNLITAAFVEGIGAYWRTGAMVEHSEVKSALGLKEAERLVGFIYLGTPMIPLKSVPQDDPADFFKPWPSK